MPDQLVETMGETLSFPEGMPRDQIAHAIHQRYGLAAPTRAPATQALESGDVTSMAPTAAVTTDRSVMEGYKEPPIEGKAPPTPSVVRLPLAPKGKFDTPLSPAEEQNFMVWKQQYAPQDSGVDYDLRGAFKAGLKPDPQTGHWPDTYKKPNHPTFSVESQYASAAPERAGSWWHGEKFVPPLEPIRRVIRRDYLTQPTNEEAAQNALAGPPTSIGVGPGVPTRQPQIEDIKQRAGTGFLQAGAEGGKSLALLGAVPSIIRSAITGDDAADLYFRTVMPPIEQAEQQYKARLAEPTNLAGQVAGGLGQLAGTASQVVGLSGGAESMYAQHGVNIARALFAAGLPRKATITAMKGIAEIAARATVVMAPAEITSYVDKFTQAIEGGADTATAHKMAIVSAASAAAMGLVPVSLPGKAVYRVLTGAGVGVGANLAAGAAQNVAAAGYPELQQDILDPGSNITAAAAGGLFGAAMGRRAPVEPFRIKPDYGETEPPPVWQGYSGHTYDVTGEPVPPEGSQGGAPSGAEAPIREAAATPSGEPPIGSTEDLANAMAAKRPDGTDMPLAEFRAQQAARAAAEAQAQAAAQVPVAPPVTAPVEEPDTGPQYYVTPDGEVVEEPAGENKPGSPVVVTHPLHLEAAGDRIDTEATDAQLDAGNYKKAHVDVQGMDITVETPKGAIRHSTDPEHPWEVVSPAHYGYVKRTGGADGEQVDVYVGDNVNAPNVYLVDQIDPATGKFDEHKAMIGFTTKQHAVATYHAAFNDGSGPSRIGAITQMTVPEFKEWLKGDTTKAVAYKQPKPTPQPPKEAPHATPVRSDEGQVPATGPAPEGRKDQGGEDLQRPPQAGPVAGHEPTGQLAGNLPVPRPEVTGLTAKHPNVVVRDVRDNNGHKLGDLIEPYDGTKEGARAAAERISRRMPDEFPGYSNIQSRIGATDENGNPKWVISPNLKHVNPVGSREGDYTWGDMSAAPDPTVESIAKTEASIAKTEKELAADRAKQKAGVPVRDVDDRFGSWDDYLANLERILEFQRDNLTKEKSQFAALKGPRQELLEAEQILPKKLTRESINKLTERVDKMTQEEKHTIAIWLDEQIKAQETEGKRIADECAGAA